MPKRPHESSSLLPSFSSNQQGPNRQKFLYKAISMFLFLGIGTILMAIGGATLWSGSGPIVRVVVWFLVALLSIFLLLSLHGFYIWNRGELPIPRNESKQARYVTLDGRQIEYFVWGSEKSDATVAVVCHGSNGTGKYFNRHCYPDRVMKDLNVKVISPSYPGHGGSDAQPHRRIQEWPKDDVQPILEQEMVDKFIVQGSSYGTAHAMATAAYFTDRCLAMGLNVPYLPEPICREFGFHTDADYILNEKKLARPIFHLPILSLLSIFQGSISSAISALPEGKQAIQQNMAIVDVLHKDCRRSFLRGVCGQIYEMLCAETNQHWVDPRTDIATPIVAVWYSEDDSACPPAHGKWLAEMFEAKEGVKTHVRVAKTGLGHLSYFGEEDTQTGIQTKVLLEMMSGK